MLYQHLRNSQLVRSYCRFQQSAATSTEVVNLPLVFIT